MGEGRGGGGCSLFLPVYFHTNNSDWAKHGEQTFTFSDDDSFVQSNSYLWELSSAPSRLQLWNSETGKYMKMNMILFNKRETGEYLKKYNTNYAMTATTCRDHFDYWPTNENYQKSKLIKHDIIRTQILSSVEKCEVLKRY